MVSPCGKNLTNMHHSVSPRQSVSMVLVDESSVFGFYIPDGEGMLRDVIPCS
jgi:hypothetical protein